MTFGGDCRISRFIFEPAFRFFALVLIFYSNAWARDRYSRLSQALPFAISVRLVPSLRVRVSRIEHFCFRAPSGARCLITSWYKFDVRYDHEFSLIRLTSGVQIKSCSLKAICMCPQSMLRIFPCFRSSVLSLRLCIYLILPQYNARMYSSSSNLFWICIWSLLESCIFSEMWFDYLPARSINLLATWMRHFSP